MHLRKRINPKLFIPLSALCLAVTLGFTNSSIEIYTVIAIYVATLINQGMLLYVIDLIIAVGKDDIKAPASKLTMFIFFIVKIFIIFAALSMGVHFMGKRIIIPLLNYVFHIFVLGVSLRRK